MRAQQVGIHAMEIYFPKTFVSQEELETYNKVGKGKYTIGLGQKEMAFVQGFEDINSIALTAVKNLLEKYNIDPKRIGRLEVGTETLLDKSKSIKTNLMQLFREHNNYDIEGVTTLNACYGGTAALFNTLAWVESSNWDGRFGIVVTADIAVYKKGPARPTGGAGAIAMLIGPDAPLHFESLRASFIDHQYDFYKPDPRSEYPTVDGHLSIGTYIGAIDNCYQNLRNKQIFNNQQPINLNNIDYACFHAPFGKMVQKSFMKLVYRDVLNGDLKVDPQVFAEIQSGDFNSKPVQAHLSKISKQIWGNKVLPTLEIGTRIGNIYTGSLYAGLASLLSNPNRDLTGKKIMMFSYGSGLCSSMFVIRVSRNVKHITQMMNAIERLDQRIKFSIEDYENVMLQKEQNFGNKNLKPIVNLDHIEEGAYYLTEVDDMFRRKYLRKPINSLKTYNIDTQTQIFSSAVKFEAEMKAKLQKSQYPNNVNTNNNKKILPKITVVDRLENLNSNMQQEIKKKSLSPQRNNSKLWAGFYKKTMQERLDQMSKIDSGFKTDEYLRGGLDNQKADIMVENCVGKISLPMGLGLNFQINDRVYQVPMAVEEPSVIAAASSAGKFVSDIGSGFMTKSSEPIMIGQIQLLDIESQLQITRLLNNKQQIIEKANEFCQSMVARGGGVKDVNVRFLHEKEDVPLKSTGEYQVNQMAVVDLYINVCDSMGANITNTICESIAPFIAELSGARVGIKILSNLCVERKTKSQFMIPVKNMAWKSATGEQVAQKIIESYRFAQLDPFRAATHNKGIMNGIDAVALALGQDWRSIEAGAHAYTSYKYGSYQPLSHYEIINEGGELYLKGSLEIPISVGTKGGVIDNNKLYESNLRLLGFPNAQKLSEIMVTVGLSQNFAALRALAIEGIQKGHMSLHAKNIAISAGVPVYLAEDCARFMKKRGRISGDIAKEYLLAYDVYVDLHQNNNKNSIINNKKEVLSSFYVELNVPNMEEQLNIHIALDVSDNIPIHVSMEKNYNQTENKEIHNKIFGEKGYLWLQQMFQSLDMVRIDQNNKQQNNKNIVPKLKLISILIDLVTSNMLKYSPGITTNIILKIQQNNQEEVRQIIKNQNDMVIKYGLSLLNELINIFHYNINQNTNNIMLKNELVTELYTICTSQVQSLEIWQGAQPTQDNFTEFFMFRKKRLCATMMLLCDCLNMRQNEINQQFFQVLKELGSIYEIEITCAHDLQKWNPLQMNELNIYTMWLKSNQKIEFGMEQKNVDLFILEQKELIKQKKLMVNPKIDDKLISLCAKTSEVIRNKYNFDEHKFDNLNISGAKPRL